MMYVPMILDPDACIYEACTFDTNIYDPRSLTLMQECMMLECMMHISMIMIMMNASIDFAYIYDAANFCYQQTDKAILGVG